MPFLGALNQVLKGFQLPRWVQLSKDGPRKPRKPEAAEAAEAPKKAPAPSAAKGILAKKWQWLQGRTCRSVFLFLFVNWGVFFGRFGICFLKCVFFVVLLVLKEGCFVEKNNV